MAGCETTAGHEGDLEPVGTGQGKAKVIMAKPDARDACRKFTEDHIAGGLPEERLGEFLAALTEFPANPGEQQALALSLLLESASPADLRGIRYNVPMAAGPKFLAILLRQVRRNREVEGVLQRIRTHFCGKIALGGSIMEDYQQMRAEAERIDHGFEPIDPRERPRFNALIEAADRCSEPSFIDGFKSMMASRIGYSAIARRSKLARLLGKEQAVKYSAQARRGLSVASYLSDLSAFLLKQGASQKPAPACAAFRAVLEGIADDPAGQPEAAGASAGPAGR